MSHRVSVCVGVCCCVCVCFVCLFNKVNFGCSRGEKERPPNVFSHVLILPHLQWLAKNRHRLNIILYKKKRMVLFLLMKLKFKFNNLVFRCFLKQTRMRKLILFKFIQIS